MKFTICALALATAATLTLVVADLLDNQIDEGLPLRYSRPPSRARYTVKTCQPCGANQCQVMGMQRFSEPRCEAFGGLGSPCRMWQEPENKTLNFPDKVLYCNDVYMQFCPCARGLVCDEAECKRPRRPQAQRPRTSTRPRQFELEREELAAEGFEPAAETTTTNNSEEDTDEMPIAFEPAQSRFPWAVARFH